MFLIVGGIMAGNLTDEAGESEALLAGFGLGELSVAVLSLTILHAFNRNMKEKFEEELLNKDNTAVQVLLYQQIILDTVLFCLTLIPFYLWSLEGIYGFLGQNDVILGYAKSFAYPFLPGVYFFTISSLFFDYADVNGQSHYSIFALAVGLCSLVTFNYFLVVKGGMQLAGVGISSSIGLGLQMLTIIALNWSRTFGRQASDVRFCGK